MSEAVLDVRTAAAAAQASRNLDRRLMQGVTWTGGIRGVTLLLSWASTIIVARILSPADYGLVAMATVYLGLTTMVTDFGLGSAIIALRELSTEVTQQLHAVAGMIGIAAFALSCVVAVPLSLFFATPALVPVLIVLSTALVLDSMRTVPMSLLARDLRFSSLSLLEGLKVVVAVVITLALAASGAGYWSLVLGNVLASLVLTLVVAARMPLRFTWPHFKTLRGTLRFSANFLMGQLAWYGYSNSDFVVAGRVLGRAALGEYTLAWTLTSAPGDKIMSVFGRVMPMMLAAVQRDVAALRRYFFLFTETLALLIVPATVGLALVAPDFVLLVFGAKWSAIVMPLRLLCIYTAIHIIATPTTPVLQVTGQPGFPARCGVATLFILPPAFYFAGDRIGTVGIAAIWLTLYPLILVPVFVRVFRTLEIRLRDYLACVAPTITAAAVMAGSVFATQMLAPTAWPVGLRLSLQILAGGAAFLSFAFVIQRRRLGVLAEFVRSIRS